MAPATPPLSLCHSLSPLLQLRHGLPPSSEGASSRRKAFLDHVLTSSEASVLGHRDLVEELKTLSAGAVGTTMDLMSFFLILNAMYPDVQDRIVKVSLLRMPRPVFGWGLVFDFPELKARKRD